MTILIIWSASIAVFIDNSIRKFWCLNIKRALNRTERNLAWNDRNIKSIAPQSLAFSTYRLTRIIIFSWRLFFNCFPQKILSCPLIGESYRSEIIFDQPIQWTWKIVSSCTKWRWKSKIIIRININNLVFGINLILNLLRLINRR